MYFYYWLYFNIIPNFSLRFINGLPYILSIFLCLSCTYQSCLLSSSCFFISIRKRSLFQMEKNLFFLSLHTIMCFAWSIKCGFIRKRPAAFSFSLSGHSNLKLAPCPSYDKKEGNRYIFLSEIIPSLLSLFYFALVLLYLFYHTYQDWLLEHIYLPLALKKK